MFNSNSLKTKILTTFAVAAVVLIAVSGVSFYGINKISQNYTHLVERNFASLNSLTSIRLVQKDMALTVLGLLDSTVNSEQANKSLTESLASFETLKKEYLSLPFVVGEKKLWMDVDASWTPFLELSQKIATLSLKDKEVGLKYNALQADLADKMQGLINFQKVQSKKWSQKASQTVKILKYFIFISAAMGFLLAFLVSYFVAKNLSKKLTAIAGEILTGAEQVTSINVQISSSSQQLSLSATQQSTALQQTAASIEEMSSMISKSADNAKKSQAVAESSEAMATKGKSAILEMIQAIDQISQNNTQIMNQTEDSNREISEIVKVIAEIENKTKVINDIVFQTKLLSFNASVEAARAGEHGRGFAVVAEEVGNLAQMSGNAAKEISALLEGSIQKVQSIVVDTKTKIEKLIQVGKEKVDFGSSVASNCNQVLEQIVSGVGDMSRLSSEISLASEEQASGVREIAKSMSQLDQMNQQNSVAAQQASGAVVQLSGQAQALHSMVMGLTQTVQGEAKNKQIKLPKKPKEAVAVKSNPKKLKKVEKQKPVLTIVPVKNKPESFVHVTPDASDSRFKLNAG